MAPADRLVPALRRLLRTPLITAAALLIATAALGGLLSACSSGGGKRQRAPAPSRISSGPFTPSESPAPPSLPPGVLAKAPDGFAFRAAVDPGHVVWTMGPVEEEDVPTVVMQRDLRSNRTTALARGVDPAYGLASTREWVAYAESGNGTRLIAIAHDGSHRTVLSASLIAPIAARGELIAWAEQTGGIQRVIVRDMAKGNEWLAAQMPRCEGRACYQIEALTLAERGVSFTRDATNPDASIILRRGFSERRVSEVRIPNDPQPELVPSSAGALYHVLDRGWYRWDFGQARPRRTAFQDDPPAAVLGYEGGRWFVLEQKGCSGNVVALLHGRSRTVVAATRLRHAVGARRGECVQLGGLTWTGRQALTGWGVIPPESEEEHQQAGLVGVVHVGEPTP